MNTDLRSIAFSAAGQGSKSPGHWPVAGLSGIAYRLANLRVSRLLALLLASTFFYIA
ncbi:MAG: hypothetical protein KIT02_03425 [Devosia sp.]|uniref:hypothetical protein n=1 Tax=Devosia sp. TaxID=1871048 RepID=UPI0024C94547|nr:hypothetical protein [Devosia sp.]UYO00286.1 MAG: hypothetical protein KIT02_03425 [Devosia sp.]